jgi:hypothetical protein
MRTKSRSAAVTLVLVTALAATGCTPEAPRANEKPTPTSTPLFASDEEALAAAEEAYAAYLAVTDQIFADGGTDTSMLGAVATGSQLEVDENGFRDVVSKGLRSVGQTTFTDAELQRYSTDVAELEAAVTVYLCEDVSGVDVVDASGLSVVQQDRPDRVRYEVTFDWTGSRPPELLVSDRDPWRGGEC